MSVFRDSQSGSRVLLCVSIALCTYPWYITASMIFDGVHYVFVCHSTLSALRMGTVPIAQEKRSTMGG